MTSIADIEEKINAYLVGAISGQILVEYVDDLVSSDEVYNFAPRIRETVLLFQDTFAFYVDDPEKRSEYNSFFGPDQLKYFVIEFREALRQNGKDNISDC